MLKSLNTGVGHLKAGFLGFAGSGKTFTATELAIAVRQYFGLEGPIAMFDTEAGAAFVAPRVQEATGLDLVGVKSRSLDELMELARTCVNGDVSVLIVDSVTHVWRNLCETYLAKINEQNRKYGKKEFDTLEFHHWNRLKPMWYRWTDLFLSAPLHIIVCGRAGFEYDFQENARGKKELVKTGTKMKVEAEFGFEPALLVEMEREPIKDGISTKDFVHRATILKDRFDQIDGQWCNDPTPDFFMPHITQLTAGADNSIDTEAGPEMEVDVTGRSSWQKERRARTIIAEEIQNMLVKVFPTRKQVDVTGKIAALEHAFGSTSWTQLSEETPSEKLREGKLRLREYLKNLSGDQTENQTEPQSNDDGAEGA